MHSRKAQLVTRTTAFFVAFVCLWMSGIATTMHADDFRGLFPKNFPGNHNFRHAVPQPPDEPCAACEWNQFGRTLSTPDVIVAFFAFHLIDLPDTLTVALHLRPFNDILFRGPPTLG